MELGPIIAIIIHFAINSWIIKHEIVKTRNLNNIVYSYEPSLSRSKVNTC